jgi:hypothetical protein
MRAAASTTPPSDSGNEEWGRSRRASTGSIRGSSSTLEDRWFYGILYEGGWGTHRITIHPFTRTETHGRGGFFIHGGTSAGSAGCIDLTSNMASFARRLAAYKPINEGRVCGPSATPHKVRLHVRYTTVYYGRGAELREIESRIVGPPGRREYVGPGGHRVPEYP